MRSAMDIKFNLKVGRRGKILCVLLHVINVYRVFMCICVWVNK